VGAFYSDWMDSVVSEDVTAQFIDGLVRDPVAPPVETRDRAPDPVAADAEPAPSAAPSSRPDADRATGEARNVHASSDLIDEARRLEIGVLGSIQPGPNVLRTLAREDGVPINVNDLANRADGAVVGEALLRGLDGQGPIQLRRERGLPVLGQTAPPTSSAGIPTKVVLLPAIQELPILSSAPVSNGEATIRKQIEPGARRCYQRGLQADPTQAGKVVLTIQIGASGEVDSAVATQSGGLSAAVAQCIADVAKRARFDPPAAGGSLLRVPFNFVRQAG
jgi:hypothetical protein